MIDRAKVRALQGLARTKNYVLITDKQTTLYIDSVDPAKFHDAQLIAGQRAAIQRFIDALEDALKAYDVKLGKMVAPPITRKPGKRIPVKHVK